MNFDVTRCDVAWCDVTKRDVTWAQGTKGGAQVSLLNIITELKKCCNHPFLFSSAEADFRDSGDSAQAVDRLVVTSGKMVLLDKLMRRLKETGHR